MVHRTQDSRLLAQLLKSEKEYTASLQAVLDGSQTSLAALSAYAVSCPASQSQSILSVVSALNGADEALKRYASAVEGWRTDLKRLRKAEEEVAAVFRDREILIGRVLKASSKKSHRESLILTSPSVPSVAFPVSPSGDGLATSGSTGTIGSPTPSASVRVNHAQAELQACEAELARKEQQLERLRRDAVIGGLQRRCRALVECGWMWGEKSKEALRALESPESVRAENANANGSADASVKAKVGSAENVNQNGNTASDDAKHLPPLQIQSPQPNGAGGDHDSQISSVTPSQSASQIMLPGSEEESHTQSLSTTKVATVEPARPRPSERPLSFSLDIPPAHTIKDHEAAHGTIPYGRTFIEDLPAQRIQHAPPSSIIPKKVDSSDEDERPLQVHESSLFARHGPSSKSHSVRSSPEKRKTLSRKDSGSQMSKRQSGTNGLSGGTLHKSKPSSDLGPATFDPNQTVGRQPYTRKRSTSFALFGGISNFFKGGKKGDRDAGPAYTGPTAKWQTRTDRNISRGGRSSSEDDLPISKVTRSRTVSGVDVERTSAGTGAERKAATISSPAQLSSRSSVGPKPALKRSLSSNRSEGALSRETAANTAWNAGSPRPSVLIGLASEAESLHRAPSKRASLDGALTGRQGSKLGAPAGHASGLINKSVTDVTRTRGGALDRSASLALPPPRLEIVRAPPSMTQAPQLVGTSPSPLVISASPTHYSHSSRLPLSPHLLGGGTGSMKAGSVNATLSYLSAPATASSSKAGRVSPAPLPLKSALRNSNSSPQRSPSDVQVNGKHNASSSSSSAGTPTMGGTEQLKEVKGLGLRMAPPANQSILMPQPTRLSDIPASSRASIISDGDSSYETGLEDFEDAAEVESGRGTPTPPVPPPDSEKPDTPRAPNFVPDVAHKASSTTDLPPATDSTLSSGSTANRRKSVRMIIHPTVTVSAPEDYTEPPTPNKETRHRPPVSNSHTNGGSSSRSGSGIIPSAWETRVRHDKNVWEDSSEEDEDYGAARRALQRAAQSAEDGDSSRDRRGR